MEINENIENTEGQVAKFKEEIAALEEQLRPRKAPAECPKSALDKRAAGCRKVAAARDEAAPEVPDPAGKEQADGTAEEEAGAKRARAGSSAAAHR